jgi:hypothetical protein
MKSPVIWNAGDVSVPCAASSGWRLLRNRLPWKPAIGR